MSEKEKDRIIQLLLDREEHLMSLLRAIESVSPCKLHGECVPNALKWIEAQRPQADATPNRYPMCEEQPAQIDCRLIDCRFHHPQKGCINEAPAITLNNSNKFVCWSEEKVI